jgi:hypothetical protein
VTDPDVPCGAAENIAGVSIDPLNNNVLASVGTAVQSCNKFK